MINFDIRDTPEDAMVGARAILALAQQLQDAQDLDGEVDSVLDDYIKNKASHNILHAVHYY